MSFQTTVALFILCLDDLSLEVTEILKSSTIIELLSTSPFMSINTCLTYLNYPVLGAYTLKIIIRSFIDPYIIL